MSNSATAMLVNPFVGLRSFEENEDYLFFGRGTQIDELLKKLNDSHFLAVIGASGSGKSSLVKSGLLPAVYSGFMTVGSNWRVVLMQPGENPIGYLTKALSAEGILYNNVEDAGIPHDQIIEASLRRSENGLVQVYKDAHLPAGESLLIVVDQFEELFRFSKYEKENNFGKSDAMHFVQILLTAALQRECPVYVLMTMRSDFLGDCAEFRGLPEAINNGQYLVPRMTRDQIREAITGPVAVSTATIAQRLVTRLLNDINNDTDQLPILQHAMMRTWDAWYKGPRHDLPIDFGDYEKIGTMRFALSQHADEAYGELITEKEQQVCELMFKALTDKAADSRGIRRPRSITDLCLLTGATQEEVCKQVEIFRKAGRTFLMPAPGIPLTNDTIIDISHESLMRVWDRLVKWTEEEARSGDVYIRLVNAAELKEQGQRGLLKDPELEIALKWKAHNKPTPKWAEGYKGNFEKAMIYLEESRVQDLADKAELARIAEEKRNAEKRAARRKLYNAIAFLLVLLLIGALMSNVRYKHISQEVAKQRDSAQAQKNIALNLKNIADSLRRSADSNAEKANKSADTAKIERNNAQRSADTANNERNKALDAEKRATDSARSAQDARDKAVRLQHDAIIQNYKTASSEYARLIREEPLTKKEILRDNFDYKLIAYCRHLDTLQSLIEKTGDATAIKADSNLMDRLYYNNDLYEKIYGCFETINDANAIIPVFGKYSGSYPNLQDNTDSNKIPFRLRNKVTAFTEGEKDRLVICATNDKWIYVFTGAKEDSIPMGATVTALSYNSDKNIIYFGLESGDIGYIFYNTNKKSQPVFENALGSPVTAIQQFRYTAPGSTTYFLLTAARKSKVVVYELDENNLLPDKRLLGNTLPEKNLVDITDAGFHNGLVIFKVKSLKTNNETIYSWDPFTASILKKYSRHKKDPDFEKKYFYPAKIYKTE